MVQSLNDVVKGGVVTDMWKIRKLAQEKVVPDHAPTDYMTKILNDPFKMTNSSTGVSKSFVHLIFGSESSLWFVKYE